MLGLVGQLADHKPARHFVAVKPRPTRFGVERADLLDEHEPVFLRCLPEHPRPSHARFDRSSGSECARSRGPRRHLVEIGSGSVFRAPVEGVRRMFSCAARDDRLSLLLGGLLDRLC